MALIALALAVIAAWLYRWGIVSYAVEQAVVWMAIGAAAIMAADRALELLRHHRPAPRRVVGRAGRGLPF